MSGLLVTNAKGRVMSKALIISRRGSRNGAAGRGGGGRGGGEIGGTGGEGGGREGGGKGVKADCTRRPGRSLVEAAAPIFLIAAPIPLIAAPIPSTAAASSIAVVSSEALDSPVPVASWKGIAC